VPNILFSLTTIARVGQLQNALLLIASITILFLVLIGIFVLLDFLLLLEDGLQLNPPGLLLIDFFNGGSLTGLSLLLSLGRSCSSSGFLGLLLLLLLLDELLPLGIISIQLFMLFEVIDHRVVG
jgi:hypothetical protein